MRVLKGIELGSVSGGLITSPLGDDGLPDWGGMPDGGTGIDRFTCDASAGESTGGDGNSVASAGDIPHDNLTYTGYAGGSDQAVACFNQVMKYGSYGTGAGAAVGAVIGGFVAFSVSPSLTPQGAKQGAVLGAPIGSAVGAAIGANVGVCAR